MKTKVLSSPERIRALADQLKQMVPVIDTAKRRRAESPDAEAWQIATALSDIEESTHRLFDDFVPKLLSSPPQSEAAANALNDIGEEYRHILYHILDTKLFGYVVPTD